MYDKLVQFFKYSISQIAKLVITTAKFLFVYKIYDFFSNERNTSFGISNLNYGQNYRLF